MCVCVVMLLVVILRCECDVILKGRAFVAARGFYYNFRYLVRACAFVRSLRKGLLHHVLSFFVVLNLFIRLLKHGAIESIYNNSKHIVFHLHWHVRFRSKSSYSRRCARCGDIRWHKPVYYNLLEQVHKWTFPAQFLTGSVENVIKFLYCPYFRLSSEQASKHTNRCHSPTFGFDDER